MRKDSVNILIGLLLVFFWSCKEEKGPSFDSEENVIEKITVSMATRDQDDTAGNGDADNKDTEEEEEEEIFDPKKYEVPFDLEFDSKSVVFLSQQTASTAPFKTSSDIYAYRYIEDSEATWEEGYNFTPRDLDNPLEWFKIGNTGSYLGGFQLYALYFPKETEIPQRVENGNIYYSVQQDQSTLENLIKSDILGAYHSTPTLFTRLNFRLFHLMTYLRIRLYVPDFDKDSKTGFYDDALVSASVENATPEFVIEWGAIRSPDSEGPAISPLAGEGNIIMYYHPLKPGVEKREIYEIEYENFVPNDYFDQPLEGKYDRVRVYDFSVLIPMQKGTLNEDGTESSFTQTDFLSFNIKSNSGAITKYVFNQSKTANSTGSNLQLTQGNFQYMELYVPRVGNRVIYAGSKLNQWSHRATSFPLTDQ